MVKVRNKAKTSRMIIWEVMKINNMNNEWTHISFDVKSCFKSYTYSEKSSISNRSMEPFPNLLCCTETKILHPP